jgi:hypothetical protein
MIKKIALLAAVLAVVAVVSPVQAALILNFDENGNGSISINGGAFTQVIGTLTANPSCSSLPGGLCLTYILGGQLVNIGEGAISDSSTAFVLGDGLRFTDANGSLAAPGTVGTTTADRMIYFSDVEQVSDGALANTGFPTNFSSQFVYATEVGPEGSNGFTYSPSPNVYNGISDIPEPDMVVLLGSGALALALARRLRRTS